jgi:DNA topoisomerase-3
MQQLTNTQSGTRTQWIKNYSFRYNFPTWGQCDVVMTSVAGHLQSTDFPPNYQNWRSCDPEVLFDAPIVTYIDDEKKGIAANIESQARHSQILFIWTDCDREGEHIGGEVRDVALKTNPRLRQPGKTVRARFSNIERTHIIQAARTPIPLDESQVNAVAARIELDLRIGLSFTRWQTITIVDYLKARGVFGVDEKRVLSYGSCQFPTLGFVVDRYFMVKDFVPEPYWAIKLTHIKDDITVNFRWARTNLFDRMAVVILFERCLMAEYARVVKVQTKPASKWKPLPLTTVELQKMSSRFLRMDSQRAMKIAEDLYNRGFISYPRTETDQFDQGMDLRALVQRQTQSPNWGPFAQKYIS